MSAPIIPHLVRTIREHSDRSCVTSGSQSRIHERVVVASAGVAIREQITAAVRAICVPHGHRQERLSFAGGHGLVARFSQSDRSIEGSRYSGWLRHTVNPFTLVEATD